ncbi:MAG: domain S-box/diguanylate cyclase protein [Firmicutes bacterium]|nr:domain S-box/diguanylate cyclase protein [Bacillota bacterium]
MSVKKHSILIGIMIWLFTFALPFLSGLCPAAKAQSQPDIIILNSYARDMEWTNEQIRGIMKDFIDSSLQAIFHVEYLDGKYSPDPQNPQLMRQLFTLRYMEKKIDLLITTDEVALEFALKYRGEIFSDAPIVFTGVSPATAAPLIAGRSNVTGVYEVPDAQETVRLMQTFNPALQTIYFVYDNTERALQARQPLEEAVTKTNPRLNVVHLNELPSQAIAEQLQKASDNSAVLVAAYSRDTANVSMEARQFVELFSARSRVPVYILYDIQMVSGPVGGSLVSPHLQGQNAAQLGLRILNGEPATAIPPVAAFNTVLTIDYDQLLRYHLPTDQIPPGSTVLNKPAPPAPPASIYTEYKTIIWTAVVLFLLPLLYITILVNTVRKRKIAEINLKKNNEELAALYQQVVASQNDLHIQYKKLTALQEELHKSKERYKLALTGANDGLWDWDIKNQEIYFSDRCCAILGLEKNWWKSTDEKLKTYLKSIVSLKDQGRSILALKRHFAGKTAYYACEQRIYAPDGEKWIMTRGKALTDKNGQPVRMAGSIGDITERKKFETEITYLAYHDSLTRLANRVALHERLDHILEDCSAPDCSGAVLFIDIDNFKFINDTYSHSYGDRLLINLAREFEKIAKGRGIVARMGGDEFVMLLENIKDQEEADLFAKKVVNLFAKPLKVKDKSFQVTVSIGITLYPANGDTAGELLKNADLAMYRAKRQGKNQYLFFDQSIATALREKLVMSHNLHNALANNELCLWYQPQIELATQKTTGLEALLRWQSKEHGFVIPLNFIDLAEDTGLIVPIGLHVIKDACRFVTALHQEGYAGLTVTVNISVLQLRQEDFVSSVGSILKETGIVPGSIGFEITESVLMENIELHQNKLLQLKEMGVIIYLDDFGTGYSSLKYLNSLPIDVVKIDKSFVDGMLIEEGTSELTKVIINLAHQLGLSTTAEGVETPAQLAKLAEYRCDTVQGNLFSKAVPESQVRKVLEAGCKKSDVVNK